MDLINWPLIRNPANWFVVALMVALPAVVITVARCAGKAQSS